MTSGILATARSGARSVGIAFLDCFLPRFCAVCRARLGTGGHLCADCANLLRPEPFSYCPLCRFEDEDVRPAGRPQEVGCPVHAGVRGVAGMHVREPVLQLTHRLKYSGERWLAGTLADLMPDPGEFDAGHQKYDLMCPVPLHRTRLRERGFNQSAELAAQLVVRNRSVILVDDLVTTGSTVSACIEALRSAGAGGIVVLTAAA